jgi:arginine deiminase
MSDKTKKVSKHIAKEDNKKDIYVASEIGTLRRLLIHSPDGGIGKIIPSKFQDWLYDDTVFLKKMQEEYSEYVTLLLYFLDPEKIKNIKKHKTTRNCFKPDKPEFYNSDKVIELQKVLSDLLSDDKIRTRLISAICALENCSYQIEQELYELRPEELSKTFISGIANDKFIFPPIPNFVFTRDIGITIKDHLLLSKMATQVRKRETILTRYIAYYFLFKKNPERVIEVNEESDFFLEDEIIQKEKVITIEGGDVMMISPNHLLVGCSERTSPSAIDAIVHTIFGKKELGIDKISVVKIPQDRAQMHIDTIFTQISRSAWVLYGYFSEKLRQERQEVKHSYTQRLLHKKEQNEIEETEIVRFEKGKDETYRPAKDYEMVGKFEGIEDLMYDISVNDFGCKRKDVKIIYSGNNEFPYDEREQWTDSCNLLALKEGVVIGYDRNEKTMEAFKSKLDFNIIRAEDLIEKFESGETTPEKVENTLILLSSFELSRARGGSHCMSMPLLRDSI